MISIDGSYGEGGGQILRLSVALSAVTQEPVMIKNIRCNRPNPGLRPQHVSAIHSVAQICNAKVEGNKVGSSLINFYPSNLKGGKYSFDIGTAGSVTLMLQACIIPSLFADENVEISITGGTDVKWAPPWDYFHYVFLSHLNQMNINIQACIIKRGYYPRGGGRVNVTIKPLEKFFPIIPKDKEKIQVKGIVHSANLPMHIAQRIKKSAVEVLSRHQLPAEIEIQFVQSSSAGAGIVLWTQGGNILGADSLGEKGVSAEKIGSLAATKLIKEIQSDATLDIYAVDQMLPYLALSNNGFFLCRTITKHATTEMWLLKKFLKKEFIISPINNLQKISNMD